MSRFRSLMGAAGAAGAGIAAKYVDDEIATNRAQMLAELQRKTAGLMREDADAFENDPNRVARDRLRRREDTLAGADTAREVALRDLTDPALRGAKRAVADEDFDAETGRKLRGTKALMPVEAERAGLLAEAQAKAAAKYREPRAGAGADVAKKIAEFEKVLGRPLTEAEKLQAVGLIKPERNPELDTVDIEETVIDPKTGRETKTKRREVRRPGAKPDTTVTPEQAHAQARAAIAAGAPADAVNKRLTDAGFEPLAAAAPSPRAAAAPPKPRETDPIRMTSTNDLRRIAAVVGHANQKAAQAELARRAAEADEEAALMDRARMASPGSPYR